MLLLLLLCLSERVYDLYQLALVAYTAVTNDSVHTPVMLRGVWWPPFSQIDIIGAMVIVWRVRGENYQICSVQYCVQQLCTVQCTHVWTDLTVLWIGFCLTGPISLCLDSFLCLYHCILHVCMCSIVPWWGGPVGLKPILRTTTSFSTWHCWLGHLTHKNPSPI